MRTQVRKVDALEEGEGMTADAGLMSKIKKSLVSRTRGVRWWCERGVDGGACGMIDCDGGDVHNVTLRRRSDSQSASYAVIHIATSEVFSSYAVIHNDAEMSSGNLAATVHNDAGMSSGNLAGAIHSDAAIPSGNIAAAARAVDVPT